MKRITLITLLFSASFTLWGQPYVNVVQLGYSFQPGYGIDGHEDKVNFTDLNLDLSLPIVLKNEDVILVNSSIRQIDVDGSKSVSFESPSQAVVPADPLQAYTLRLGYRKKWNDTWNSTILLQGRRTGSLNEGASDALQLGAIFIMEKQQHESLALRYGAYLNQEFFGTLLVPIIGLDWKPNEKWNFFGLLPITGTALYKARNQLELGANFTGLVTSFRLPDRFEGDYLHHASTDFTVFADLYLNKQKNLVLSPRFGRSIGRYYRQNAEDDKLAFMISAIRIRDDRSILNEEVGDGWIAEIRLIFRVMK